MPWIDVEEPFAAPPRVVIPSAGQDWDGPLDLDRGWAEFAGVAIVSSRIDLNGCTELDITESSLLDTAFTEQGDAVVTARRSLFERCDLSGLSFQSLRTSRLTGCKLVGADFAGGVVDDVVFENCSFRYVSFRMAKLKRVQFIECTFDDVDLFEATLESVGFPGSTLTDVNVDRLDATRVDLREANEVGLTGIGSLRGCLVAEDQLPSLMYTLAFATGLDLERRSD